MKQIVNGLSKFDHGKRAYAVLVLCATAIALPAQDFHHLDSFNYTDGSYPQAGLVQAADGDLYGTTTGGPEGLLGGTVFKITPGGTLTTLYSFCSQSDCADGASPTAALVQATNGSFYGTTLYGGASPVGNCSPNGCGTVFKMSPCGTLTTLHSFCSQSACADGYLPEAGLVQAAYGDLYGATLVGGANAGPYGAGGGTVFKITPGGTLTTLYSFCSQSGCRDGFGPSGLVQATNGDFYGTTGGSVPATITGAGTYGTVFKITASAALTTLYRFCKQTGCPDGAHPGAGLVEAANGDFFGTTMLGGANCAPSGCGTVFKITPSGTLTTLYSFCSQSGCADGERPQAALIQGTDGNLYGTTYGGGASGGGTVFKITPTGMLTTLFTFCGLGVFGCTDGETPLAGLVQATNGDFYGTTGNGGASNKCYNGCGTIFNLSEGLGPFVKTLPASARVGTAIMILGTSLAGAASVSFNGTEAVFAVVSSAEIATVVPFGATTGEVKVRTPSGTLSSNGPFRVLP